MMPLDEFMATIFKVTEYLHHMLLHCICIANFIFGRICIRFSCLDHLVVLKHL